MSAHCLICGAPGITGLCGTWLRGAWQEAEIEAEAREEALADQSAAR